MSVDNQSNSSLRCLIDDFVNPESDESLHTEALGNINSLFSSDNSSALKVQDIIVASEQYLTSTDDKQRYRSTLLIAEILKSNPSFDLNSSVIHLLISFFNQRLSDYPSIVPSILALKALLTAHSSQIDLKYMDHMDIFKTIFKELYLQNYGKYSNII